MDDKNKKFKLWWDDKEKLCRFKMGRDVLLVDEKLSQDIYDDAVLFIKSRPEKNVNLLVDVSKSKPKDARVRKILAKTMSLPKLNKVAFLSEGKVQRIIVNFVVKASGKKKVRQFETEKEALEWLNK